MSRAPQRGCAFLAPLMAFVVVLSWSRRLAASTFRLGLKAWGDKVDRRHGYTAAQITRRRQERGDVRRRGRWVG